jgi:hypothetical protein
VEDTCQKFRREGVFIPNLAVQKNLFDTSSSDDVSLELEDSIDSLGMGEFSVTHHLRMRNPSAFAARGCFQRFRRERSGPSACHII